MKKKLLPFILGLSMLSALSFVVYADDNPEEDSGNVKYSAVDNVTFVEVNTSDSGDTPVLTAIPECTMTIPRDTTIQKGALSANIGRVTIDGHYFVKPYYIQVSATKQDFRKVYSSAAEITASGETGASVGDTMGADYAKANQDIIFDVATATGAPSTQTGTGHTAADEATFVKSGTVSCDDTTKKTTFQNGGRAARRFWTDDTQAQGSEDTLYNAGEICDIKGQENVFVNIAATQWTGVSGSLDDTRPVGGKYRGSITFTAEFKDDFASTWTSAWTNLS